MQGRRSGVGLGSENGDVGTTDDSVVSEMDDREVVLLESDRLRFAVQREETGLKVEWDACWVVGLLRDVQMERLQRGRQALVDQINEQQEEIRRLRSIVASREQLLSPPRRSIAVADAQTDVTAHDLDLMAMQLADKERLVQHVSELSRENTRLRAAAQDSGTSDVRMIEAAEVQRARDQVVLDRVEEQRQREVATLQRIVTMSEALLTAPPATAEALRHDAEMVSYESSRLIERLSQPTQSLPPPATTPEAMPHSDNANRDTHHPKSPRSVRFASPPSQLLATISPELVVSPTFAASPDLAHSSAGRNDERDRLAALAQRIAQLDSVTLDD